MHIVISGFPVVSGFRVCVYFIDENAILRFPDLSGFSVVSRYDLISRLLVVSGFPVVSGFSVVSGFPVVYGTFFDELIEHEKYENPRPAKYIQFTTAMHR